LRVELRSAHLQLFGNNCKMQKILMVNTAYTNITNSIAYISKRVPANSRHLWQPETSLHLNHLNHRQSQIAVPTVARISIKFCGTILNCKECSRNGTHPESYTDYYNRRYPVNTSTRMKWTTIWSGSSGSWLQNCTIYRWPSDLDLLLTEKRTNVHYIVLDFSPCYNHIEIYGCFYILWCDIYLDLDLFRLHGSFTWYRTSQSVPWTP
jgi:hypothetical protein